MITYFSSHQAGMVILFENNNIPAESQAYLNALQPTEITIVGGKGVVSRDLENQLRELFPQADLIRFVGVNRY